MTKAPHSSYPGASFGDKIEDARARGQASAWRQHWRYVFAGQALAGLLANPNHEDPSEHNAELATRQADDLLDFLEKGTWD